jgi:glyoxalase superfamily protein
MAPQIQVTIDCADPDRLADFWAVALDYRKQDPPPGYDTWQAFLAEMGVPEDRWDAASAVVDPAGKGPRLYFQKVPESKTVKNRVHLDVSVGGGHGVPVSERRARIEAAAERLHAEGATKVRDDSNDFGEYWVVMQDPEGNEFCLQ